MLYMDNEQKKLNYAALRTKLAAIRTLLLFIVSGPFLYYNHLKYKVKKQCIKKEIYENDIKSLNIDDKYIVFNFFGTRKQYVINWKDYEFMEDNFFSNLVKYSENNLITYNTDEDYDIVKSIFQSIKYRKSLIRDEYSKSNLNYIVNLMEMWSINDDIINKYIKDKIDEYEYNELQKEFIQDNLKLLSSEKIFYLNYVFKCELCGVGFTELTNHKQSCKFHYGGFIQNASKWGCCGNSKEHTGCRVGYHIKNINSYDIDKIKILTNLK